jgi:hypothetical protein
MSEQKRTVPHGYCHCGCGERTKIAERTARDRGHVAGQPLRYIKGHNTRLAPAEYVAQDRGFATPCWIWQRRVNEKGYGHGNNGLAHRAYYEALHGKLPVGLVLDHLCRVRACVNPDHLEPVTNAENIQRGTSSPLAPDDVRAIRRLHVLGDNTAQLARAYGVSKDTILRVSSRQRWGNVR